MTMKLRILALAIAGALSFASTYADAQSCSGQPSANTVCAGPASGGSGLPGFRSLVSGDIPGTVPLLGSNNVWTGTNTFSPASGDAITINPAPLSANKALVITQSTPTSGSTAGPFALNLFNITYSTRITGSGSDATGNNNVGAVGFRVNQNITTAGVAGTSAPIITGLFTATVGTTTAITDVTGLAGTAYTNVAMSGAYLEGVNAIGHVGPTGSANVLAGLDASAFIDAGGTATNRIGVTINSGGAVAGTTLDAAITFNATSATIKFGKVFAFSNLAGQAPIGASTDIFYADTAYTVANFVNLPNMGVNGNILSFPNMKLTGDGRLSLGTTTSPGTAGSIAATGSIAALGTLGSGGVGVGNGALSLGGNTSGGWNLTTNGTGTLATATGSLATSGSITNSNNGIGTVSTDGLVLQNTTAAGAGAQQYSPRLHFIGQGWKTNATAASQTADWIIENEPVQGAANPTTGLVVSSQINGAGYSVHSSFNSGGVFNVATGFQIGGAAASANVLRGNGTNFVSATLAPADLSPNALAKVKVQKFTSGGTYTPSAGILYAIIECIGGGAGGGSASGTAGQYYGGGGGGSGAYSRAYVTAAAIGASQTVTIGGGGNGGASGSNNGAVGVASSVGTLCISNGGAGGQFGAAAQIGGGGVGGTAGTGDVAGAGFNGSAGLYSSIATVAFPSGNGASSAFGGGATGVQTASGTCAVGNNAANYGAGGSGAVCNSVGATNAAGGNGSAGIVVITEFTNQ